MSDESTPAEPTPAELSARHWERLAEEAEGRAAYLEARGEYGGVQRTQAANYRASAKATRLSAEHGEPYCSCHLEPMRLRAGKGSGHG